MADSNVTWTDKDGRLCFSMSGPSTIEQRLLVQHVGEALSLPGYFDALCGWWRGEDNRPVDVPLLRALVCAYELGKRNAGVRACLCGQPISDECKASGCRWDKEKAHD